MGVNKIARGQDHLIYTILLETEFSKEIERKQYHLQTLLRRDFPWIIDLHQPFLGAKKLLDCQV